VKQSVDVTIYGQQFTLKTDVSPAEVLRVAAFVNSKIDEATAGGRLTDSLKVVILALLNLAGEYLEMRKEKGVDPTTGGRLQKILQEIDRRCPELAAPDIKPS